VGGYFLIYTHHYICDENSVSVLGRSVPDRDSHSSSLLYSDPDGVGQIFLYTKLMFSPENGQLSHPVLGIAEDCYSIFYLKAPVPKSFVEGA
jgi:hypothetical protein